MDLPVVIKGRKSHNNTRDQIEFYEDHGYFSENVFLNILLKTSCVLTCTFPKGIWLPLVLGDATLSEGGTRVRMLEEGTMTCKVREKIFTVDNHRARAKTMSWL